MGHQIHKQADGRFAIWSTIVDDYVVIDASRQEVVSFEAQKAYDSAVHMWERAVDQCDAEADEDRVRECRDQ